MIVVRNGRPGRARLAALGAYAPARVVRNDEIAGRVDTTDEWISSRTGIRERRFAAPDETAGDMAVACAERVLGAAGVDAAAIDLVIVPTATPDAMFPSTAALVADRIYNTLDRYGNTSAASIPMALAEARDAGRLRPGDLLLLVGFGGGLTWASTVVRYEPLGVEVSA